MQLPFGNPLDSVFSQERYLSGGIGNHRFAQELGISEPLRIAPTRYGTLHDVAIFEENTPALIVSDNWQIQRKKWLKEHIITNYRGVPMVIVDNHNSVLPWWYLGCQYGLISPWADVMHFDAHSDLWENENNLSREESLDHKRLWDFTYHQCTVANYVLPAQRAWVIKNFTRIEGSEDLIQVMDNPESQSSVNLIVNVDIDFFMDDLAYIDEAEKVAAIRYWCARSQLITVATSPGFIEEKTALAYVRKIFDDL